MHDKMKIRVAGSRYMKICIVMNFFIEKLKRIKHRHDIIRREIILELSRYIAFYASSKKTIHKMVYVTRI